MRKQYELNEDRKSYKLISFKKGVVDVVIPDKYKGLPVTTIDDTVFFRFHEMESVYIPASITNIGNCIFLESANLKRIVVDKNN